MTCLIVPRAEQAILRDEQFYQEPQGLQEEIRLPGIGESYSAVHPRQLALARFPCQWPLSFSFVLIFWLVGLAPTASFLIQCAHPINSGESETAPIYVRPASFDNPHMKCPRCARDYCVLG